MFLTRMYLNPRRRQTGRFLRDPQAMHAAVESAFPPHTSNGRRLWRIDGEGENTKLLLLSEEPPSLEHVQEQAGWQTSSWETRPYEPLLTRLRRGQQYGFRLVANPVHTVTLPSGEKKRVAHVSARHQLQWLAERAEHIGVEFLPPKPEPDGADHEGIESAVKLSSRETLRFRRGEQQVTLARAQFDGTLEVANVDALRQALVQGIGRAKAYGCGLMTLTPLRAGGA